MKPGTVVAAAVFMVTFCVTVVAEPPCVTRDELRLALHRAAYEITVKGGYNNQKTWRKQAYEMVLKQYAGRKLCDAVRRL